ncbi:uncharacterized protein HMPREF1541_03221 [Cyphellophora europaea CBS 101466]|uniref:Uncharacterized protein n=1 Tax=Cyphellophora europaea (strain CBS 101466) TaxID=1220924 RepID=W2RXP0_CYPE1|nr:uncharacterized protein HMPREF1541_03221 [Cyphellophora europaea CBS 101466]ETN41286.1 hypothetical protein HMPREF1541_03221 [Cyphellophora europaea CBS 101466]
MASKSHNLVLVRTSPTFSQKRTAINFSPIHIALDSSPDPTTATTTPTISGISTVTTAIDPLVRGVYLPSNYTALDQRTQARVLLSASLIHVTDADSSAALAHTIVAQQLRTQEVIDAHAAALRYLDALNKVKAKRQELASYLDARAPEGRCGREWGLGETEKLVAELEGCVAVARGLREGGVKMGEGKGVEEEEGRGRGDQKGDDDKVKKGKTKKSKNKWADAFAEL